MNSKGIHHITAIAGNPQTNIDFYEGILELKLIKKTVNFDDPGTYHFYFGDEVGRPGTILTFFPWGKNANKGRRGRGQVISLSFSVPSGSLKYWEERFKKFKVVFDGPYDRFGENVISIEDPDGIEIELIENGAEKSDTAIRGFKSATLSVESLAKSQSVLTGVLGFNLIGNEGSRYRFESEGSIGNNIDLIVSPDSFPGIMGAGAIHHIAFRAADRVHQHTISKLLMQINLRVTEVIDRKYFKSVYFREPNGILFEIATDLPGFLVDEKKEDLGKILQLPEWFESKRNVIEKSLQQLKEPSPERVYLLE